MHCGSAAINHGQVMQMQRSCFAGKLAISDHLVVSQAYPLMRSCSFDYGFGFDCDSDSGSDYGSGSGCSMRNSF